MDNEIKDKKNINCKIEISNNKKYNGKFIEYKYEAKSIWANKVFNAKFIIGKEILEYKEDLIVFLEIKHNKKEKDQKKGTNCLSVAKQVKIPLDSYKEHDENNICYEVELYLPKYKEYLEYVDNSTQPNLNTKGPITLSKKEYRDKECSIGIMLESELYNKKKANIIKKKSLDICANPILYFLVKTFINVCMLLFYLTMYDKYNLPTRYANSGDLTLTNMFILFFVLLIGLILWISLYFIADKILNKYFR